MALSAFRVNYIMQAVWLDKHRSSNGGWSKWEMVRVEQESD
jgi:hypothetical protein